MPVHLLVQPRATLQHLQPLALRDAWAIVIDPQLEALGIGLNAQAHLAVSPLAGVVQQVAQQLQEVFTIPWQ
ncbi:hypothetical protein D3C80_2058790 [compost metagenome]